MPASAGYVPTHLGFKHTGSEEDNGYALPTGVRERLAVPPDDEHVHWWATKYNAAMFRRRRLILAELHTTASSSKWHVFSYDLDPTSLQVYEHDLSAPRPADRGGSAPGTRQPSMTTGMSAPPPVSRPPGTAPLPEEFRGYLGNLPMEAQQFLQLPFSQSDITPTVGYTYRFHDSSTAPTLTTMCLLASRTHAAFMHAERHLPRGTTVDRSWFGDAPWHARLYYIRGGSQRGCGGPCLHVLSCG